MGGSRAAALSRLTLEASGIMKIRGHKNQPLGSFGPVSMPAPAEASTPAEEPTPVSDRVDLSSTQQLRKYSEVAKAMPTVRTEKVAGLKGAVEEGNYYVETEKLARKVVDEVLSEALMEQR